MTSDLSALLAAVVANPADDVARLVYADCLEESGNQPRARFIRLQVEAERLHEHSAARAELERQAQELFDSHWIAWWGEVCAAVGFPAPKPRPAGVLGRFAVGVGVRRPAGWPYFVHGTRVSWNAEADSNERLAGLFGARFRRGFPDAVEISHQPAPFLSDWPTVSPLAELAAYAPYADAWPEGSYLAGVRSVELWDYEPAVLTRVLTSPHLAALDSLKLSISEIEEDADTFATELATAFELPRARQLKRLSVPVWNAAVAEAIAGATTLSGLEALDVSFVPDDAEGYTEAGERLAVLAASPHLTGLTELITTGVGATGFAALQHPIWRGLRKLQLEFGFGNAADPLAHFDGLPHLDDLRLSWLRFDAPTIDVLVRAPLLKRVRHLSLSGSCADRALMRRLAAVVDADRIETFALVGVRTHPLLIVDGTAELRVAFGERLRIV